jgi:hypothetical protein
MTKIEDTYYKAKYRFQWWWYGRGGGKTVEAIFGVVCMGVFAYSMWWVAYLLEP